MVKTSDAWLVKHPAEWRQIGIVAVYLGLLDADFTVSEPAELVARLRVLAGRYRRASAV